MAKIKKKVAAKKRVKTNDAGQRIVNEFNRLVAMGREKVAKEPYASRVVNVVVIARCEKDMEGFDSIFEQAFKALKKDGFYRHWNWNKVSESVKGKIGETEERVGDELWGLDGKLAALLDEDPAG